MISKSTALGFAAALAFAAAAQAQTTMPGSAPQQTPSQATTGQMLSKADQAFLKMAIQTDLAEIQMGQLAQQKGQSEEAKQFGQTLQQDHSQNLDMARQLAQQHGMTPPSGPAAEQKKMHDRVGKLSGTRFDRQFARDMVRGHKKAISAFQAEAKRQGPLAQFAQATVPVLQKHLQIAQSIENQGAAVGRGGGVK
jgi:putative membrane protein